MDNETPKTEKNINWLSKLLNDDSNLSFKEVLISILLVGGVIDSVFNNHLSVLVLIALIVWYSDKD